ncbi:hypothetical protein F5X68DRAFT_254096 [Plectosphaerella plurivora]|uniref:Uncharacterized protein n=1 Tax=Plectosphaerella plurivora TaxID=936078 RepID=A0A9P9ACL3_9PEZI|nr:hypothetical protein F5X68DRAFT_254096 [Plectosphaerella plurivora]
MSDDHQIYMELPALEPRDSISQATLETDTQDCQPLTKTPPSSRPRSLTEVSSAEDRHTTSPTTSEAEREIRQELFAMPEFGKYCRDFSTIATDMLAATLPLICPGFVIAPSKLDDKVVNPSNHQTWLNTIIAFGSVFPIAFATIISQQMLGSRTFGGAILTQMTLGTFNILGASLIVLWAFSPLGTQALLRTLYTEMVEGTTPLNITYRDAMCDTGLLSIFFETVDSPAINSQYFLSVASTLVSLLKMPDHTRMSAMDPWDNVKIPFYMEDNQMSEMSDEGWQILASAPDQGHEHVSALVGVQIDDVPIGNTTLAVESTYIELTCYNLSTHETGESAKENVSWAWGSFYEPRPEPRVAPANANNSWQGINLDISNSLVAVDRFVDINTWTNSTWLTEHSGLDIGSEHHDLRRIFNTPAIFADEPGVEAHPTTLYVYAWFNFYKPQPPIPLSAYCDIHQKYVETQVLCERWQESARQTCVATAQRPSRKKHASEVISFLNFPGVFEKISEHVAAVGTETRNHLLIDYLANPSAEHSSLAGQFQNVNEVFFGRSLAQLFNT